jgi:hypothetical protein
MSTTLEFDRPVSIREGSWFEMRRVWTVPYQTNVPLSEEYHMRIGNVLLTVHAGGNRVDVVDLRRSNDGVTNWPKDLSAMRKDPPAVAAQKPRKRKRTKTRGRR